MSPTYQPGDYVVCVRWPKMVLKRNQIVVAEHPIFRAIIKRIHSVGESKNVLLIGDNRQSVSTENMGWIDKNAILGKVVVHVPNHLSAKKRT